MKLARLLEQWEGRCVYCARPIDESLPPRHELRATRDHFVPRRKGGQHTLNILPACTRCNSLKGCIDPRYFLMLWLKLDPAGFLRAVEVIVRRDRLRRNQPSHQQSNHEPDRAVLRVEDVS